MRGKACSVEFMRRIQRLRDASEGQKPKDIVKFISAQICISTPNVRKLLRVNDLAKTIHMDRFPGSPWPSILRECLSAPNPEALARRAIEGEWTAEQTALEASRLRASNGHPPPIVPTGKYGTLVVDPPWDYGNKTGRHGVSYKTMTLEQVCAFDIQRWLPEGPCHLYLWVTDAYAGDVYQVTRAWGFDPKAWLVWVKDRIGMGNYYRHQHEFCVFAVRGRQRLKRMDASTVFKAKNTGHSAKPAAFYDIVESCSPGPYIDVFGRTLRAGWDVFGDEVNSEYQLRIIGRQDSTHVGKDAGSREAGGNGAGRHLRARVSNRESHKAPPTSER